MDWPAIAAWRRDQRQALLTARAALGADAHRQASRALFAHLETLMPRLIGKLLGFYWPIRHEPDPLPFVKAFLATGGQAALPAVVAPKAPLEFRPWHPGTPMAKGVYDIPYPTAGAAVTPEALLIPLLGFDAAGYRLGFGGGFYDRTLAAMQPAPLRIGLGFAAARLATIHPQPHDIPMDFIVTEAGVVPRAAEKV